MGHNLKDHLIFDEYLYLSMGNHIFAFVRNRNNRISLHTAGFETDPVWFQLNIEKMKKILKKSIQHLGSTSSLEHVSHQMMEAVLEIFPNSIEKYCCGYHLLGNECGLN